MYCSNEKSKRINQLECGGDAICSGKNSAPNARWLEFSQLIHNRNSCLTGWTIRIRTLAGSTVVDFHNNFRHGRTVAALPCRKL
jgi:hypothetical protein